MIARTQGLILLQTLLTICLLSLIVLSQLQLIFIQFKALNHVYQQHQAFNEIEAMANKLTSGLAFMSQKSCIIAESTPNDALKRLNKDGCVLKEKEQAYQLLIEDLGVFSCLQAFVKQHHSHSTRHWRLTLRSQATRMTLQYRIATVGDSLPCRGSVINVIAPGVISWRYLPTG